MALLKRSAKAEALWRNAWASSPHQGEVDVGLDETAGEECLVVKCPEVLKAHGQQAVIVDDGRSVHVQLGDFVYFGIVTRQGASPVAVNIFRTPPGSKRRRIGDEAADADPTPSKPKPPVGLDGTLVGVVRNSDVRGNYFLECKEVFKEWGRDVRIDYWDIPDDLNVGDAIRFRAEPPHSDTSPVIAKDIEKLAGEEAQAVIARGFRSKGKGKGKGGWAGGKGKGKPKGTGEKMRMTGIVKRRKEKSSMHAIFCQDVSDVYGRDALIPKWEEPESGINVGDKIVFDIEEQRQGYQGAVFATNIKIAGRGKSSSQGAGDGEEDGGDDELELEERDEEDEPEAEVEEVEEKPAVEEDELREAAEAEGWDAEPEEEEPPPPIRGRATLGSVAKAAKTVSATIGSQTAKAALAFARTEANEKALAFAHNTPSTGDWEAAQDRLFGKLPPLKTGWIRIMSKSKGMIYYYNTETGESSAQEPKK